MKRFPTIVLALLLTPFSLLAQDQYTYKADLKNITNDQVSIELTTPLIKEAEAIFSFPKAIPGSYSQKDYGRFITDFVATDKSGKPLKTQKINNNQFRISNASTIAKISYKVNDTWDADSVNFIFQPGGSNIDAGKNVVLNNHAFFGYFEGYTMLPFEVRVLKPANFYASTHLDVDRSNPGIDVLKARNYVYLADNPVLYAKPDTTSFISGNSRINVSVYSTKGEVNSKQIAEYLKPMATALQKFFNGLPVSSYQFIYFFEDPANPVSPEKRGGYGALEHNYSSLYFLPESSLDPNVRSMVNEVSSHEFLHILTPLNLHSEEIEHFDFTSPKMSQHLWLYEGVTEYFANLVQLQNGLLTEKEFISNMQRKISDAEKHGLFSMTEMSRNVLTDKYQSKYESVYNKGALTGLLLDLSIRQFTNNDKDLKRVIQDLAKKYGPQKPFKDEALFPELVKASHPGVQAFIDDYIVGDKPLPYQYLQLIGYEFLPKVTKNIYYAGNMGLGYNEEEKSFSFKDVENNSLKIKEDDVFVSVNGIIVTLDNVGEVWEKYFKMNTTDPALNVTVKRAGVNLQLSGPLYKAYVEMKNILQPVVSPTAQQATNLGIFLGKQ